jgi:two-component system, NarL family, sensor histidine kinase BarA
MAFGQSSFRRLLLYRLLLVSLPILLIGVYFTYRKVRSALLETARQNLTESAIKKAENLTNSLKALQGNLITASNSQILLEGSSAKKQAFLRELATILPTYTNCVQLTEYTTDRIIASTCNNLTLANNPSNFWTEQQEAETLQINKIYTKLNSTDQRNVQSETIEGQEQLEIISILPIYNPDNQLEFTLKVQSKLIKQRSIEAGLLTGYTVILDQQGNILAHPYSKEIGRNIAELPDYQRLNSLLRNAIAGNQDFLHLFSAQGQKLELLAGYTAINSPITEENNQKWVIISVTELDRALAKLKTVQQALLYLTLALTGAMVLASLYIAHSLSAPLEKLGKYALQEDFLDSEYLIPQSSNIKEINQLTIALNNMLQRAKDDANKIRFAWKEAEVSNRLKSEFLATTSHELRTPLNGIINCIQIVKDDYCDSREEEKDFLEQAGEATIHLLSIINDVLDISKIEAGKVTLSMSKVHLNQIIQQVIDLQCLKIQSKKLTLIREEYPGKIIVNADKDKLRQVLINILGNAVKFTDSGSIAVKTTVVSIADNHSSLESDLHSQRVIITISDTGIGINPKDQEKLFRPFVMVDGSTTRKYEGTGLGLAISLNLIRLMGGNINLTSEGVGKGTTVEVSLPIIKIEKIES